MELTLALSLELGSVPLLFGSRAPMFPFYSLNMLTVADGAAMLAIDELMQVGVSGGPNIAPTATASATSTGFGWVPANANNNILGGAGPGAGWHAADGSKPQVFTLQYPAPVPCYSYSVYAFPGRENQAPGSWQFRGSLDGSVWVVLDTRGPYTAVDWSVPGKTFVL